jgi:hypothetical protein
LKWLGQHIVDIVARFRSLIYLEGVENLGSASDKLLALDSDNKVIFRTKAETANDLAVIKSLKFVLNNPTEQPAVTSGDAVFSLTGSNGVSTQLAGGPTSINIIAVPGQIDHDSLFGYNASQHIDWTAENAGTIHASNYSGGFTAGDGLTLTGSDLDLDASLTTVTSILNTSLKIGRDADNLIDFATTDNQAVFRVQGADKLRLTNTELRPNSNDGLSLGTQYRMWSDLFLADGGIINFNDGDVTLTHAANSLTMAGGAMTFSDGIADSGTISAGTWQGGVIASAYLDSDTAHLSGNQTFSGTKTFSSTISGSIDGNASTATALTAGNKTIDGNLTIGANQAGHDFSLHGATTNFSKCMWDASHNQLHFSDQAKIVFGTGGGPGGSDSSIQANGSDLVISNTVGDILIGDSVEITGNLDITGIVRPGISAIKILPSDFIADDVGRPVQIDDVASNKRFLKSHSTAKLYASIDIPLGFKATAVDVFGSGTSSMSVHIMSITSESIATTIGNGSIGTTFNFSGTPVNGSLTDYLLIELAQTSSEKVYGGAVTIAKI